MEGGGWGSCAVRCISECVSIVDVFILLSSLIPKSIFF